MKIRPSVRGTIIAFLLLSCAACTGQKSAPLEVRADKPITVTQTEYVPIQGNLLNTVESAVGFAGVWVNGDMYNALVHDSQWLDTCKAQIDGIRVLYENQAKAKAAVKP